MIGAADRLRGRRRPPFAGPFRSSSVMPLFPLLADEYGDDLWFRPQASTFAGTVDSLWWLITWISVFFFVLVVGAMGWFMWRYRHRPVEKFESPAPDHNLPLELTWTVIPTLLVIVIFGFGFTGYLDQRTPPADAYEVRVIAKKWAWDFIYVDAGFRSSTLYIPADRPVKLRMTSQDVIHSFFVPAFRAKWDVVPGRDTEIWFECNRPGSYLYECTEYCGTGHSSMIKQDGVVAIPLEEFEERLAEERRISLGGIIKDPLLAGEKIYLERGCSACHSVDGRDLNCPTWEGLYGKVREFADGTSAKADPQYIRESIIQPDAKVVKGYPNIMISYKGALEDIEIEALTLYIKSLSEQGRRDIEKFGTPISDEAVEAAGIDRAAVEAEMEAEAADPGDGG